MPGSKRVGFVFATIVAVLSLAGAAAAGAQGLPQPKVGGSGSLDGASSGAGSGSSSGRRPLGGLTAAPEDFSNLTIAPGFLLSMEVYDTPEFSSDLRVDTQGEVTIAMVGPVHVAGLTLAQASAAIADRLREKKILNSPQVTLNVSQYSSVNVSVLGEVHNPGRIEMLAPHSVADVIALAGGETEYAGNVIDVRHAAGVTPQRETLHFSRDANDSTLSDNIVRPGDTITVHRAGIVYVLGAVTRPGGYVMQEGGQLDFSQALALAYGTSINAAVGSIRLIRKQPDGGVKEMTIAYRDIVKGKIPPPRLQAEDMIYVPVSKVKTVLTAGLINTAASSAIYVIR